MKDPRLYSHKLRYCREVDRRLKGTKSEGESLGEAHFVRNYALLTNYLH